RTALNTMRSEPSSPRLKTSTWRAITPAGYRLAASPNHSRSIRYCNEAVSAVLRPTLPTATIDPEDGATRSVPVRAPRERQEVRHALGNPRDSARAMGPRPHREHRRWIDPPAPGPGRDCSCGPAPAGSQLGLT